MDQLHPSQTSRVGVQPHNLPYEYNFRQLRVPPVQSLFPGAFSNLFIYLPYFWFYFLYKSVYLGCFNVMDGILYTYVYILYFEYDSCPLINLCRGFVGKVTTYIKFQVFTIKCRWFKSTRLSKLLLGYSSYVIKSILTARSIF